MSEFKREGRYVVIKLKDIDENTQRQLGNFMQDLEIPTRSCVVVESDWPEYEPVWKMLEDRMTGKATLPQEPVDEPFHALLEDYEALIRNARRCAYDYKHCADTLPSSETLAGMLQSRANFWALLFAKGNPGKDYRHRLNCRVEELEIALERIEKYFAKQGGVPEELKATLERVAKLPF